MQFCQMNKSYSSLFFAIVMASYLLVSVAQAECMFFTGWVDNKDGSVRDPRNGLIWKRCAEGYEFANGVCTGVGRKSKWEDAKLMAQQSRFLGQSDWRLPTKEELAAVMGTYDECKNNDWKNGEYAASKAIVHSSGLYWSSSPYVGKSSVAWGVNFVNGDGGYGDHDDTGYVRLVRASQVLGREAALVIEQERIRNKIVVFRKSLKEGDDTNCGPIIEVKGKLIKVAFAVANYGNEHWIKRDQILSPDYVCRFVNGQYQPLQ